MLFHVISCFLIHLWMPTRPIQKNERKLGKSERRFQSFRLTHLSNFSNFWPNVLPLLLLKKETNIFTSTPHLEPRERLLRLLRIRRPRLGLRLEARRGGIFEARRRQRRLAPRPIWVVCFGHLRLEGDLGGNNTYLLQTIAFGPNVYL